MVATGILGISPLRRRLRYDSGRNDRGGRCGCYLDFCDTPFV